MTETLERLDKSTDKRTILVVVGDKGAIHYWHERGVVHKYGGVEIHSRTPFEYSSKQPDHDDCWLLEGPCWHDGSSLYATEFAIPAWELADKMRDMERFWRWLEVEYEQRFYKGMA